MSFCIHAHLLILKASGLLTDYFSPETLYFGNLRFSLPKLENCQSLNTKLTSVLGATLALLSAHVVNEEKSNEKISFDEDRNDVTSYTG